MSFATPIDRKWVVGEQICAGTSARVFEAHDESRRDAVVKVERGDSGGFQREDRLYNSIGEHRGFPKIYFAGRHESKNVLVMQRLHQSLLKINSDPSTTFTTNDVLKTGIQMLKRLETIHRYGYVHRDLHPGNIWLSHRNGESLYLIDFGCTTSYRNRFGTHAERSLVPRLPVSYEFASINTLEGYSASRKDDLESLVYILVYMSTGSLPWVTSDGPSTAEELIGLKQQTQPTDLCSGLSNGILKICREIRALTFSETPPYYSYRRTLREALRRNRGSEKDKFSWQ